MNSGGMSWIAVVPVKGTRQAKSRLAPLADRTELATAFALDTVAALRAADRVTAIVVVTVGVHVAERVSQLGAIVVNEGAVDGHPEDVRPHGRLNSAISLGLAAARVRSPEAGLAVFTGDLPALTAVDVDAALALASCHERSLIPDADGTGTTALLALAGIPVTPRFGVGSRRAHELDGHVVLDIPAHSPVRRDVDLPDDLEAAVRLGVGAHTAALLARTASSVTDRRPTPVTPC